MINRLLFDKINPLLRTNKVKIILGARRTGKTFLLKKIAEGLEEPYLFLNGEDAAVQGMLETRTVQNYLNVLGTKKILMIDEAQKIPGIGQKLKLMIDGIPELSIIVSGSSAFDLEGKMGEPLTGRKHSFVMYTFSEKEILPYEDAVKRRSNLEQRLIYGNYPEATLLNGNAAKEEYLRELVSSYLMKDILQYEDIRKPAQIVNLLRLIAFQAGNEVSPSELAQQLSLARITVEKYLDLLSKVFIIYKLEGFSRNLRKEIVKNNKWYFVDNGIRNAIIANFSPVNLRNDTGQLWGNYIISERIKHQHYSGLTVNNYFWRTYDQQEIDFIEERGGQLYGYEMKWKKLKVKTPVAWVKNYPGAGFTVVTPDNYLETFLN